MCRSSQVSPTLQRLCYRACTIELTVHEQKQLLPLICRYFSSVVSHFLRTFNSILSTVAQTLANGGTAPPVDNANASVTSMFDLRSAVAVSASSRQHMVEALLDGQQDTFWESSDQVLCILCHVPITNKSTGQSSRAHANCYMASYCTRTLALSVH